MSDPRTVRDFAVSESGSTAVDYAVLAGVMTIAIVAMLASVSDQVQAMFQAAAEAFVWQQ